MKTISLIVMVAILLEALIEYFKTFVDMIEHKQYKTAITQGVTIVLGVFLAFAFHLHLFNDAISEFYEGLKINNTLDTVLTGILFSRGANYFSDLVSKLTQGKEPVNLLYVDDVPPQTDVENEQMDAEDVDMSEAEDLNDEEKVG